MRLSELKDNDKGVITKVLGRGAFRKRITEMGFVKGKVVTVVKGAPLKDPIEYTIMGYSISLRKSEAYLIEVITENEAHESLSQETNVYNLIITEDVLKIKAKQRSKVINVALVGNPNCGKTTLFNYASRSRERVGNYSGVTVDAKVAHFNQDGYIFNITDLPGTYSLTAYSPEELYVRRFIFDEVPDVVINVVDSSNLERNLYLTTQLIDMDIKVVIALNMYDELQKRGDRFDYSALGEMIGIPMVPTVSSKGIGIKEIFEQVIKVYEETDPILRHIHISHGKYIEKSIKKIQNKIYENKSLTDRISSRFMTIKLLEKDKEMNKLLSIYPNYNEIDELVKLEIAKYEKCNNEDSETLLTDFKYGFISGAIKETYKEGAAQRNNHTKTIDTIVTHKVFGFPIFVLFIWLMFQTTFSFGAYPMEWIEALVELIRGGINIAMPEGMFKDLILNGIIDGVGGVIVFLPNILILFFFISLMEDTGYMARAAFIMDKLMHKIGLHGKSFIPLIMGFGCNVPAIMATRTLENRNDRLLTMLINPFMSCSARLPVYILLVGAFFPDNSGTVLFSIYLVGIILAILVAMVFNKLVFKSKQVPFVMELPPYRIPTMRSTLIHMWSKGSQYLQKMGGVILIASVIIWALGYFPREVEYSVDYDLQTEKIEKKYKEKILNINSDDTSMIRGLSDEKTILLKKITIKKETERKENSYIGILGHAIEPAISPLGFDWRMGVSLISGAAAKEIVVSTMGVLYHAHSEDGEDAELLKSSLQSQVYESGSKKGQKVFSPLVAYGFMLFVLIYFPCIAVIAAIKKESGSWKWAAFMVVYTTSLAWIISFLVYQIGSLFY